MLLHVFIAFACALSNQTARADDITVSAAVSLRDVLGDAGKVYQHDTNRHVRFNFGASGELATQIQHGGAVDLFISASQKQVDDLVKANCISSDQPRVVIARNSLVLIVPNDAKNPPTSFADLTDENKVAKLAIGLPASVPAGEYAMQTLKSLKLDDAVKSRLVYGSNVRQVLAYVEGGEVSAGIVYATDAIEAGDKVRVVATADERSHRPIEYPAVAIKNAAHADAALDFLKFLQSPPVRTILKDKGFVTD